MSSIKEFWVYRVHVVLKKCRRFIIHDDTKSFFDLPKHRHECFLILKKFACYKIFRKGNENMSFQKYSYQNDTVMNSVSHVITFYPF